MTNFNKNYVGGSVVEEGNYMNMKWHQEVLLLLIYQLTSCMYYNSQVACICIKVLFHLKSGIAKGPTPAHASATISGYVAVIKA